MTYQDLLDFLLDLEDEQLEQTATVYNYWEDEYFPILRTSVAEDDGVLDYPHIVLRIEE